MCRGFRSLVVSVGATVMGSACGTPPPEIQDLVLDRRPSESVPLAAQVMFQTDRQTTVSLEIDDGRLSWNVDTGQPAAFDHAVPVLGLRPDRTHIVRVVVTDNNGLTSTSDALEVVTDPLPDDFPPIDVRISKPSRMEPGITMLEPTFRATDEDGPGYHLLVAVDETGEVVWYYKATQPVADARRLQNGNLLYRTGRAGPLYEIDMLGNPVSEWHTNRTPEKDVRDKSIHVNVDTLHHETFETLSGNILAISTELRAYDNYPTSDSIGDAPKATSEVLGDVLVEFDRRGNVLRETSLLDLIDPYRIGYNSLDWGGAWRTLFSEAEVHPRRDWAHANAVVMDESERFAIVSLRHQDAVVKIDLDRNELVWILGNHDDWGPKWQKYLLRPLGEVIWPFHQHAPMITPHGTLLLFDNGNYRARPFDDPIPASESFSRAVEYRINEEMMEVEELWSYGGPGDERFFARFLGDADWMPQTGNILINFGGLVSDPSGVPVVDGAGHNWVRIVEVTHESPAEKVFEIFIDDDRPAGWSVYRAERLPSLYP
ncbi:MAG: hypothetical protein CL484_15735 [Acidobacteria bacterium]|nr:hypothetical protein [Acidobacteriota bacterium]